MRFPAIWPPGSVFGHIRTGISSSCAYALGLNDLLLIWDLYFSFGLHWGLLSFAEKMGLARLQRTVGKLMLFEARCLNP